MTAKKQAYVWGMRLENEMGVIPDNIFYAETRARAEVQLEEFWEKRYPTRVWREVFRNPRKIIYAAAADENIMIFVLWGPVTEVES